jgi:beta-carotene 15,15'-dioxygenase
LSSDDFAIFLCKKIFLTLNFIWQMEQFTYNLPFFKSGILVKKISNGLHILQTTPTIISVFLGVFLLNWQFFSGDLPMWAQFSFFIFMLLLTGIPHGALDHLVEKETAKRHSYAFSFPIFILKYVLTMLFYGAFWMIFPSLSLLFFLLISAWHFGETDLEKLPATYLFNFARFIFGCFVLLLLLLSHEQETGYILTRISQNNYFVQFVWQFFVNQKQTFLVGLFVLFVFVVVLATQHKIRQINYFHYILLGSILILTYFLPLLPAFALYFGGWHALCSFKNTHEYLAETPLDCASKISSVSIYKLWFKTLLFTSIAFVFLAVAVWCWFHFLKSWDPLPVLFIFLSIITLPHLNIMHRMNKNVQIDEI